MRINRITCDRFKCISPDCMRAIRASLRSRLVETYLYSLASLPCTVSTHCTILRWEYVRLINISSIGDANEYTQFCKINYRNTTDVALSSEQHHFSTYDRGHLTKIRG